MSNMNNPLRQVGFICGEFTYAQPNGVSVRAPLEFWCAANLTVLTDAQRAEVLRRVELIRSNELTIQDAEGFTLRVSNA